MFQVGIEPLISKKWYIASTDLSTRPRTLIDFGSNYDLNTFYCINWIFEHILKSTYKTVFDYFKH